MIARPDTYCNQPRNYNCVYYFGCIRRRIQDEGHDGDRREWTFLERTELNRFKIGFTLYISKYIITRLLCVRIYIYTRLYGELQASRYIFIICITTALLVNRCFLPTTIQLFEIPLSVYDDVVIFNWVAIPFLSSLIGRIALLL